MKSRVTKHLAFAGLLALLALPLPLMSATGVAQGVDAPSTDLPPPGQYVSPTQYHEYTAMGIVLDDPSHKPILDRVIRTTVGNDELEEFDSVFTGTVLQAGTLDPLGEVTLTGPVTIRTIDRALSPTGHFDTEIVSMNLSGPSPMGTIQIQQDPARPSWGGTDITDIGGGLYHIDSFFDVFTEARVDPGTGFTPWVGSDSSTTMTLVPPPPCPGIAFDTELVEMDLTGGPYPMPLASDPLNNLGDSIDGYGFVDSQVTVTLSSQRASAPGPQSLGQAHAFDPLSGGQAGGHRCEGPHAPIDPDLLDGQQFVVDSFFDVFFDITVTDVDSRPGRDFAGQPDGASIPLEDNGPANVQSFFDGVIFDKDLPNFGLIPPPEAAPYNGHINIEIPLGADLNGNGENDKIKFTLVSHAAGDGNRTFIILPDGTVMDEFDSAAFMAGAIVDESTDPPFTIGAGSASAPAFSGPGAMTGPTTASSLLLNPVVPEPSSLVLLGMGALGFLAFLRRRKRAV